jgi:hypothetical protein
MSAHSGSEEVTIPSLEALHEARQPVSLSRDAKRLCWSLAELFSSAICVMDDIDFEPDIPTTPYCLSLPENMWHKVSKSPLTEPKVSSVVVCIDQLEDWEDSWFVMHDGHHDPDEDSSNGEFRFDADDDGTEYLTRCCNQESPQSNTISLTVEAAGAYITIHDYVSAVHPWLLDLREVILRAEKDISGEVLPVDAKLMVELYGPGCIHVADVKAWIGSQTSQTRLAKTLQTTTVRSVFDRYDPNLEWGQQEEMPGLAQHLHEKTRSSVLQFQG